ICAQDTLPPIRMQVTPETLQKHGSLVNLTPASIAAPSSSTMAGNPQLLLEQYHFARSLQDWPAASQALIAYHIQNPQNTQYLDTLLELYQQATKWESVILLGLYITEK